MSDILFIECKICNCKCNGFKGLATHIAINHKDISLEQYYIKYINTSNNIKCKFCDNKPEFKNLTVGYSKYCKQHKINNTKHTCKICNKAIYLQGIIRHLHTHNIDSLKLYYDKYLKKQNEGLCKICNKPTNFINLRLGYHEYCSCTCMGKDDNILEKRKQTCLTFYGVDNTGKLPQSLNAGLKAYKEKTGLDNPSQDEKIIAKGRHKYKYNDIFFDSSWELAYYIWLTDNNIPFQYHPEIKFEYTYNNKKHYYFVDFYVNNEYQELKGPQFFDENKNFINPYDRNLDELYKEKYKCMLNNNIKIILDCKQYIKYVHKTYGKNFITNCKIY